MLDELVNKYGLYASVLAVALGVFFSLLPSIKKYYDSRRKLSPKQLTARIHVVAGTNRDHMRRVNKVLEEMRRLDLRDDDPRLQEARNLLREIEMYDEEIASLQQDMDRIGGLKNG